MRIITFSFLSLVCSLASCSKNEKVSSQIAQGDLQASPSLEAPVNNSEPAPEPDAEVPKTEALAFFKALQSGDPSLVKPFLPVPDDCELMRQEIEKDGATIETCRKGISALHEAIDQWLGRAASQFKDMRPTGVVTFIKVPSPNAPEWAYQVSIDIEGSQPLRLIAAFKFKTKLRFILAMKKTSPPIENQKELAKEEATETGAEEAGPEREELEAVEYEEGGSEPLLEGTMQISGIAMKVLVSQPKEGKPVVAQLRVGTASPFTIGFKAADYPNYVQVVGEGLPAFGNGRLAMIQIFLDSGEDVFSRSMVTALVFLGDAKTKPKLLWQGEGKYHNSFGECETSDVISFVPFKGGQANVMRHREVVVYPPEDGDWVSSDSKHCVAKPKKTKRIARVKIP